MTPRPLICLVSLSLLLAACDLSASPLVPATVAENPALPSVEITVLGRTRRVYVQTAGNPDFPALFVMPGSLSDTRCYEPLLALADRYRVVIWDQRGQGLSERVGVEELSFEAMVEEIAALKGLYSPDRPIAVLGHSWSAVFAALYAARHPRDLATLILLEPIGLSSTSMRALGSAAKLFSPGYMDLVWLSDLLGPTDHETLDFRMLGMTRSVVRDFFKDPSNPPPWPVRRVGGLALLVWEARYATELLEGYDYGSSLSVFEGRVLLVGSGHSPIGFEFQKTYNAPFFTGAAELRLLELADSGHRMITEAWPELERGLRAFLEGRS